MVSWIAVNWADEPSPTSFPLGQASAPAAGATPLDLADPPAWVAELAQAVNASVAAAARAASLVLVRVMVVLVTAPTVMTPSDGLGDAG